MSRRWRAIRLRSRSDVPPQTPWSIWFAIAYSKQGCFTGQSTQIRRATSTPTPSLGKNVSGGTSQHLPRAIHEVSTGTFCPAIDPRKPQFARFAANSQDRGDPGLASP